MLRSAATLALAALLLGWPAGRVSREEMYPVRLADGRTLLVARHEVTVDQWRACHADGGCALAPPAFAAADNLPMTGVNWFDVADYVAWANARGGGGLRLPRVDEWRSFAGTGGKAAAAPLFDDPRLAWAAAYGQDSNAPAGPPRRAGAFGATVDGIADLGGNVWEWTATCASAVAAADAAGTCPAFVVTGAHEAAVSVFIRDPASGGCSSGTPPTHLGLRLVAEPVDQAAGLP